MCTNSANIRGPYWCSNTIIVDITQWHVIRARDRVRSMNRVSIGVTVCFAILGFFSQYYSELLSPYNITVMQKQSGTPKRHVSSSS